MHCLSLSFETKRKLFLSVCDDVSCAWAAILVESRGRPSVSCRSLLIDCRAAGADLLVVKPGQRVELKDQQCSGAGACTATPRFFFNYTSAILTFQCRRLGVVGFNAS